MAALQAATGSATPEIGERVAQRLADPRLLEGVGDADHRRLDPVAAGLRAAARVEATSAIPT